MGRPHHPARTVGSSLSRQTITLSLPRGSPSWSGSFAGVPAYAISSSCYLHLCSCVAKRLVDCRPTSTGGVPGGDSTSFRFAVRPLPPVSTSDSGGWGLYHFDSSRLSRVFIDNSVPSEFLPGHVSLSVPFETPLFILSHPMSPSISSDCFSALPPSIITVAPSTHHLSASRRHLKSIVWRAIRCERVLLLYGVYRHDDH